ncbi:MAG: electron transfer flavoprotein subunit beta [Candidatus Marinimicrobia bacterium]|nr:electron transfer flavoprotein subunit beta [Candidatus Neomarinimicrobiota bacterium]
MKIAVLIKQVPGSESALPIDSEGYWVDESSVTFVMNPPDNYALEEALLIKESNDDVEVVIVSMGPLRVQKVIREALAKGADRGIHILEQDITEKDPLVIAKRLSNAIKSEEFDLVLTGLQSDDTGMGQTGVLIGEILKMSTATLAVETIIQEDHIRIKRELESGWFQWVQLSLPASISIQSGLNTPRYPSLKGIMGAKKKEIHSLSATELSKEETLQKVNNVFVPQTNKQTEIIKGDIDQIVSRIIEILRTDIKVI